NLSRCAQRFEITLWTGCEDQFRQRPALCQSRCFRNLMALRFGARLGQQLRDIRMVFAFGIHQSRITILIFRRDVRAFFDEHLSCIGVPPIRRSASGVRPSLSFSSTFAPFPSKAFTTSARLLAAASLSAVAPSRVLAFRDTSFSRRATTT